MTSFFGGANDPAALELSDAQLAEIATDEFETVTGSNADVLDVHRIKPGMPARDKTWTALERIELPEGLHLATNYTSRAGLPGRVRDAHALAAELAAEQQTGATNG